MRIYLYDVYSLLSQIHMLLNNVKNMSVINWDKKKKGPATNKSYAKAI